MFDAGSVVASLTLDRSDFTRGLSAARSEAAKGVSVPVTFDISQRSVTQALTAAKKLFAASPVSVAVDFGIDQASVARATSAAKKLFAASPVSVPVTFGINAASVGRAMAAARALFAAKPLTVPVVFGVTQASVNRALSTARGLFAAKPLVVPVSFSISKASVAATVAQARALFAGIPLNVQVNFSTPGAAGAAAAAGAVAGATTAASAAGRGAYGVYGLLTKQLTLFGGALEFTGVHMLQYVSVLHLGIDWIVEFSAVLIPATIALTAFGIAAAGTLVSIYQHLKDVQIVSAATGQAIAPLTGGFAKLQAAVKPQVYQLFGDALTLMSQRGGAFAKIATSTGSALDYLGARMTVAITQGKGVGGVMAAGADDVAKLGAVVGNLGGTFGNVLKAMPGYAEIFLNLWVAVSKGAEIVTSVTVPILNAALALHGFIVYAGLAVTAVLLLKDSLLAFGAGVIKAGISIAVLGGEMLAAAASGDVLAAAMLLVDATGGPLVWITVAVAALGALVVWMLNAKSAAEQWNASMQKTIDNAPTIAAGITDITNAIAATSQRLAASQKTVASTAQNTTTYVNRYGEALTHTTTAYAVASDASDAYRAGLQKLNAEQQLSQTRLLALGEQYGGATAALGLLTTAGITEKQWQDKSANGWAIIQQQLAATTAGYKAMGVAGGAVGNDLQILGNQALDSYKSIATLNTGLDTFIGNVTKTQGSFDTLALGNITLAQNFTKANEAVKTTTHTLDGVKAKSDLAGAAMDGLSQASLTLNQAFGSQVSNVQALLDTWRVAGVAQNLQTQGTKDAIEPLLKYAAGSREATAQLAALAEEAGYNGPASMKALTAWLGKTHDATKTVKDITNQATIQEALLTSGMKGQGDYISSTLLNDLSAAELKYSGVTTDVQAWGKAIATQGSQSDAAQGARTRVINDLITTGKRAHETTGQIAAMITKITGIPPKKAVQLVVSGTGSYSVTQSLATKLGGKNLPPQLPPPPKAARGMLVTGGTPGKDSVLVNAMPGEVIVPTKMVSAGAVNHLRGSIPGFAAGGVVGSYSGTAPGVGGWAVKEYDATITAMEKSVAGATAAAEKTAAAAASIAGATTSAIGDLPANYRAIASFMTSHGYSNTAAAGIAGNTLQESGGNPESVGDGGGGLIGFTPLPSGYVTGNPGRDLATQLNGILSYNRGWSQYISGLNAQPTAADAAAFYMNYFERPAKATENAQRREAGANAVFKAMGYAGGSKGAAPGWAQVGEHGRELVRFGGGETVLPNSVTERVMSGTLNLPGYAKGTGKIKDPNPVSGFTAAQRKADEARLAKYQKQLAAMEKTATAHVTSLRVPIDRDELYLLEHPDLPKAKKAALEKQLSAREAALTKYRKTVTGDEGKLTKEIALLKKIIATEPAAPAPPAGTGPLPPGIGKGTKAQNLAELAKYVTQLAALKKKATAELAKLNIPVEQDELYLLQHPGLGAGKKASVEAALTAAKKKVAAYRKTTGAQETTLSDEITILRSLTGEPSGTKYGGAAPTAPDPGTGDGGTAGGGTTTSGPPPGQFVGTLPAPPGEGGAGPVGGGTGGLGGSGTSSGGAVAASPVSGSPVMSPGGSFGLGSGIPGGAAASGWGITPVSQQYGGGINGGPAASSPAWPSGGAPMSGSNVEKLLSQLLTATRAAPAQTGGHLAGALNGTARIASGAGRWNAGS